MSRLPQKSKLILHSSKSGPKLPLSERSQIIPNAVLLCRGILFQLTDLSFKKNLQYNIPDTRIWMRKAQILGNREYGDCYNFFNYGNIWIFYSFIKPCILISVYFSFNFNHFGIELNIKLIMLQYICLPMDSLIFQKPFTPALVSQPNTFNKGFI